MLGRHNCTPNGASYQRSNRLNCKKRADSSADLANVGYLRHQGCANTDEAPRSEAKNRNKNKNASYALDGYPDHEAHEGRKKGD